MAKTALVASGFHGPKLYQQRARVVLPILVRQAEARQPIFYEALAQEVGMPNPRNLNYPLGCIGRTLNDLAKEWDDEVPPIEALVVNQQTRFPGPGFNEFLTLQAKTWSNERERRALIEEYGRKSTHTLIGATYFGSSAWSKPQIPFPRSSKRLGALAAVERVQIISR